MKQTKKVLNAISYIKMHADKWNVAFPHTTP